MQKQAVAANHQTEIFDVLGADLASVTWRYTQYGIANAAENLPFITQTIKAVAGHGRDQTCIVVSGGPSIKRRNSLERIKPLVDKVIVVAADGAMGHCLRAGIVPDYVVSVDPDNPKQPRIIRWFGDEALDEERLAKDDYFRRQDLDSHFNEDELARNREQIQLVNESGSKMRAVLSTSASPAVRSRCYASGMNVLWWNPIYDDPNDPTSVTRRLNRENKAPCMNTGGNVGTASLIFAVRVLGVKRAVMLGMDFSYYSDTPYQATQYYDQFLKFMLPAEIPHAFKWIHNPHLDSMFYTDPAYNWYCESFHKLFGNVMTTEIVNATEGGILFGGNIKWQSIEEIAEALYRENNRS